MTNPDGTGRRNQRCLVKIRLFYKVMTDSGVMDEIRRVREGDYPEVNDYFERSNDCVYYGS